MDLETRYRRGIFLLPQENLQLIQNRVATIINHSDLFFAEIDECKNSILNFEIYEKELEASRELLHLDNLSNVNLLTHTEKLISQHQELESQYWEAMWAIKKFDQRNFEHQKTLRKYADLLEVQQSQRDKGWPENWSIHFCDYWQELGGTKIAANAWSTAGWWPAAVFLQEITQEGKPMSMQEKLRCITPPPLLKIVEDQSDKNNRGFESEVVA